MHFGWLVDIDVADVADYTSERRKLFDMQTTGGKILPSFSHLLCCIASLEYFIRNGNGRSFSPPKKDQPAAAAAPDGYTTSAVIAPKAFERGWSRDGKSFMDLWGDVYPSRGGSTLFMTDVITFVVMMPIPEFSRFHDNVRESPKFNLYLFKKGKKKVEGNSSSAA